MRDTEHTCVAEPYGTTTALPVHIPLPRWFFYVRYSVRSPLQQFRDSDPYREPYSYASFSLTHCNCEATSNTILILILIRPPATGSSTGHVTALRVLQYGTRRYCRGGYSTSCTVLLTVRVVLTSTSTSTRCDRVETYYWTVSCLAVPYTPCLC